MNENQSNKDATKYSVEVSKQFLTLASAGVAFAVGLVFSDKHPELTGPLRTTVWLFSGSIASGLIYLMSVVGQIGKNENYDVYSSSLRFVALVQVVLFMAAIGVFAFCIM
jgi:hypothetical protein